MPWARSTTDREDFFTLMPDRFFFNPFSTPILSGGDRPLPRTGDRRLDPRADGVAIACCKDGTLDCIIYPMHPIAQPDRTNLPLITDYRPLTHERNICTQTD
ncbi:MAG: hypothetical protein GDA56_09830 [Hormoscilla sp. GM7CHS1pb]|nr:hypothetical protein [Hormoscilla sp. GM7CHS1pb]